MEVEFKIEQHVTPTANRIDVQGPLDENANLPGVTLRPEIHLNLDKVTAFNAIGTRSWSLWVAQFQGSTKVLLTHCPFIMVKNFGSVRDLITPEMEVISFYVPFYSPQTGESHNFLAVKGVNFSDGSILTLPDVKDSEGRLMEPDIFPETYLSFLKR